jgi:cytoskeletal protein CcmA (bactofilin family)
MNWIYILVVCLAIYYIAARYLEKHIDNFDPSLVPVSSIVTLAKVAQKLVDGGGTLTSPGNLTLGTPAAPGNLIVTGTTNLVGDTKVDGSLTVNGNKGIAINGTEVTTKSPFKFSNNNNTWLSVSQDSHNYLIFRNKDSKDKDNKDKNEKLAEIDCDTTINRGLTVNGTSNLKGDITMDGSLTAKSNAVINGSVTIGPKTDASAGYIFDGNSKTRFSWMTYGNTIVNALPGNIVEFNDSNGIPSGVNINMNGTLTSPTLTATTANITTANITNITVTNIKSNTGLTYMPIIAKGTVLTGEKTYNLVNCTIGNYGNGTYDVTFAIKPPNTNYVVIITRNDNTNALLRSANRTIDGFTIAANDYNNAGLSSAIDSDFIVI